MYSLGNTHSYNSRILCVCMWTQGTLATLGAGYLVSAFSRTQFIWCLHDNENVPHESLSAEHLNCIQIEMAVCMLLLTLTLTHHRTNVHVRCFSTSTMTATTKTTRMTMMRIRQRDVDTPFIMNLRCCVFCSLDGCVCVLKGEGECGWFTFKICSLRQNGNCINGSIFLLTNWMRFCSPRITANPNKVTSFICSYARLK